MTPVRHAAYISTGAGVWYCDVCALGGDAIQMYMRARRLDFADAVRELAA
jgi:DNA primase